MSSSEKIYYEVSEGFLMDVILENRISENERYIFEELTNASPRKIVMVLLFIIAGDRTTVTIVVLQFVIFKPLSYCFKETTGFDVKASFASRPESRLIR